ncbi:DNA polymerase III DnaE [compost metagenome]
MVNDVKQITKTSKIYIKIPKDKFELETVVISDIKKLAVMNSGNNPVYIYYEGTNKVKMLNKEYWLESNEEIMNNLVLKFGYQNVRIM